MYSLQIQKQFAVSVERLYAYFSDPALMQQWFAPGEMIVAELEADARVDGAYRITMQDVDGQKYIVAGVYQVVEANQRLQFSWQWQDSPNTTLVDLCFEALDDANSQVTIAHSEFVEEEYRDKHQLGWNGCLANLLKAVN